MLSYIYSTLFIFASFLLFYRLILGKQPKRTSIITYSTGYFSLILIMFIQSFFIDQQDSNFMLELYRLSITFIISLGAIILGIFKNKSLKTNTVKSKKMLTYNAKLIVYLALFVLTLILDLTIVFLVSNVYVFLLIVSFSISFLLLILCIVTITNKIYNKIKGDAIIIVNNFGYNIININDKLRYNINNYFDFTNQIIERKFTGIYILNIGHSVSIKVYIIPSCNLKLNKENNDELHLILYNWTSKFIRINDL